MQLSADPAAKYVASCEIAVDVVLERFVNIDSFSTTDDAYPSPLSKTVYAHTLGRLGLANPLTP